MSENYFTLNICLSLLPYCKIYVILSDIGNDNKQMWFCHQSLRIFVGRVVMFMVEVILFLIISLMLSLTLNVALTAVLYKNWVDISNYINKKAHICTLLGRCEFSQTIWQNHVCGFSISYIYYTHLFYKCQIKLFISLIFVCVRQVKK